MDGQVLQVTREDLTKFTVDLEKTLGDKQESKFDDFEKKLDKSFSDFKAGFSKPMSKEEKIDKSNELMGKAVVNLFNRAKGRKFDQEFVKTLDPQDEGTAADGGTLVPTITAAEILRLTEEWGQGRQYFRNFPMGKAAVITFPKKLAGATVTRTSENTAITDTKVTLTTATLTASKVAAIVAITSELDEDSIVDIGAYVNEQLAEAFAEEEDSQIWAGTGSPHTGAFNASSTYGLNTLYTTNSASIGYKDLVDCAMGIKSWYLRGAAWYMHRTVAADLMNLRDQNDQPMLINAGDPMRSTLLGYPVRLIESAPASTTTTASMPLVILGNMQKAGIFGLKRDYTMKVLTEATIDSVNLAENDLIGIRVTKRDAFTLTMPTAISAIKIQP